MRNDLRCWNGGTQLGYRKRLDRLYHTHAKNTIGFERVAELLQQEYPGNYQVQEAFVPSKMSWGPRLVFEDEQEEIMFRLKYE